MEYHQHKTSEFYDLFLGANAKESILMIITTAGMDLTFPCFTQEYQYASDILFNKEENEEYFTDILEIDEDDDYYDKSCWYKANPIRMTYAEGIEKIEDAYNRAKSNEEKMVAFRTKCCCEWVQFKADSYISMDKFKLGRIKEDAELIRGQMAFVGVDISSSIDLASVTFTIKRLIDDEVKYIVFSHSFIGNEQQLRNKEKTDKQAYSTWVKQGYITITNSDVVDQNYMIDWIKEIEAKYELDIHSINFDPANASLMMLNMENMGYIVNSISQTSQSMSDATTNFREEVYFGNVLYFENPLLEYCMSSTVLKINDKNYVLIDKKNSVCRIDPIDALLDGFKIAMYEELNTPSYDDIFERYGWGD